MMFYIEITYPDGSSARWAADGDQLADEVTSAVQSIVGEPDTILDVENEE